MTVFECGTRQAADRPDLNSVCMYPSHARRLVADLYVTLRPAGCDPHQTMNLCRHAHTHQPRAARYVDVFSPCALAHKNDSTSHGRAIGPRNANGDVDPVLGDHA